MNLNEKGGEWDTRRGQRGRGGRAGEEGKEERGAPWTLRRAPRTIFIFHVEALLLPRTLGPWGSRGGRAGLSGRAPSKGGEGILAQAKEIRHKKEKSL